MDGHTLRLPATLADANDSSRTAEDRTVSRLRSRALFLLKLTVTILLSIWIVRLVDWGRFWTVLSQSKLQVIALVVIMRFWGLILSSFKWQQLLAVHGLRYRLGQMLKWYLVATFLNHFLPTSIGGDGYRIYKTWNNDREKACSVLAIFLERASGLAALLILGFSAAVATYLRTGDPIARALSILGVTGVAAALPAAYCLRRFRLLTRLRRTRFWPKWLDTLTALAGDFRDHPRKSVLIAAISFLFHFNRILVVWLLLYALGDTTNLLELAVAIPVVEVVGLLPISLGGLGLVEGSFIYVMGHYGVGREVGLATMLLMRVLTIPYSLVGAGIYFLGDRAIGGRSRNPKSTRSPLETEHYTAED